jgi:hypothetical protein
MVFFFHYISASTTNNQPNEQPTTNALHGQQLTAGSFFYCKPARSFIQHPVER